MRGRHGVGIALFVAVAACFLTPRHVSAFSGSGGGTTGDPYLVSTCAEFESINSGLTAYYKLIKDIDCSTTTHTPIGSSSTPFSGSFDGDGYMIIDVTYNNAAADYAGVFGSVTGSVTNVHVYSAEITGKDYVGGVAGKISGSGTFSNILVSSSTVTGKSYVGGAFGQTDTVTITNSVVIDAAVNGSNTGSNSADYIGGFIGRGADTTVRKSATAGTVTGNATSTNSTHVGGFIGYSDAGNAFHDSYSTMAVTGYSKVGGFVGSSVTSSFSQIWASGSVTGNTDVGGVAGEEGLSGFTNSFSVGAVTGVTNVGGFIGHAQAIGGDAGNSFHDIYTSGQTNCVGLDSTITFPTTCTGVNAANSQPSYFLNNHTNPPLDAWDFSAIWRTQTGLPKLLSVPGQAGSVSAAQTHNSLTAQWTASADTGGSAVLSYELRYRPNDGSAPYVALTGITPASSMSQLISGLKASTSYLIEVRAVNALGKGAWQSYVVTTSAAPVAAVAKASSTSSQSAGSTYAVSADLPATTSASKSPTNQKDVSVQQETKDEEDGIGLPTKVSFFLGIAVTGFLIIFGISTYARTRGGM